MVVKDQINKQSSKVMGCSPHSQCSAMVRLAARPIPRHLREPGTLRCSLSLKKKSPAIRARFGSNFYYNYGTVDKMGTGML